MAKEKKENPIEDFNELPLDILEEIQNRVQKYHIKQRCNGIFFRFKPTLFVSTRHIKAEQAQKLLTHVVRGEEAKTIKMIKANPKLLLVPSEAVDYSGRRFKNITAFQAALLAHDVQMWQKMEPYFNQLPNGEGEKSKQFKEIFPKGLPKQKAFDFTSLIQTISNSSDDDIEAAIQKKQNDTAIYKALKCFRSEFTALAHKERFFNPWHLIQAFKDYHQQQKYYDGWKSNRCSVFWSQVIGYVQRFLPACYAQAFCEDLYDCRDEGPKWRMLTFHNVEFFPLRSTSSGLGFDFGVYSFQWVQATSHIRNYDVFSSNAAAVLSGTLTIYVDQIQRYLQQLEGQFEQGVSYQPK